ncbi:MULTISPECIES: hypothetical protein [unclassified Microcoleus]|uniref:hypothetical protein n=1 Tax=unclassified Microcoleus TaxID=2642155 RepID=UPI002FD72C75
MNKNLKFGAAYDKSRGLVAVCRCEQKNQNPSQQVLEDVPEPESNCSATNTQQLNQIPSLE